MSIITFTEHFLCAKHCAKISMSISSSEAHDVLLALFNRNEALRLIKGLGWVVNGGADSRGLTRQRSVDMSRLGTAWGSHKDDMWYILYSETS